MRIRSFHPPHTASKINVTPLIDVVMVLIVFYLIVGKLATDQSARVDLPRTQQGTPQVDRGVVLSLAIDDAGQTVLTLDGESITASELASRMKLRMPQLATGPQDEPVSLRADRRFTYEQIKPIVDACKAAGVTSLKLITTREGGSP
jgi:biopolymer transport protein ExbD